LPPPPQQLAAAAVASGPSAAQVEGSSPSSLGTSSVGSSDTAALASGSIDDGSSIDSSAKRKRPRGARVPELTCDTGLMRVLVLAHRFELLHQVSSPATQANNSLTAQQTHLSAGLACSCVSPCVSSCHAAHAWLWPRLLKSAPCMCVRYH
jgi:hypothetical protein